ncbi:MAG TPA: DUF402 domain-containing protein [Pyrinomonadaceae bacterium]|nr:DUF402 domain-containing protein [Pyrinomonadaceae bacterium]
MIAEQESIVVRTRKYNGVEHRSWTACIIHRADSLLVLDATFDRDIEHDLLGKIAVGTRSVEYYWLDRWYNVFRFCEPNGELKNFYCNINVPPEFDGRVLSYVDLDIDVLVAPDFSYQILDLDEFERNAELYQYPLAVQRKARQAVDDLIALIDTRSLPFTE